MRPFYWLMLLLPLPAYAQAPPEALKLPRAERPPVLEDFLNGRPVGLAVSDFRQYTPGDGVPVSQPTTSYLSYDSKNLYVGWICKDDPGKIRARVARRKDLESDDRVTINIDTFHDHRRAYWFDVNPYGIQYDGITTDGQGDDTATNTHCDSLRVMGSAWHGADARGAASRCRWESVPIGGGARGGIGGGRSGGRCRLTPTAR